MKILKGLASILIVGLGVLLVGATLPIPGNYRVLSVQSGSMEPAIKTGSVVLVRPSQSYQVDDVITFISGGLPITHRISNIDENGEIITKGDANEEADITPVEPQSVQGKVLFSLPFLGFLINFLRQPQGFIFLIVIPGALLIYEELKTLKKAIIAQYRKTKSEDSPLPKNTNLVLLFFLGLSLGQLNYTYAYFSDQEISTDNILEASASFSTLYDSNPYTCPGGATNTNNPAGIVSFDFGDTTFDLHVIISGGIPASIYDIWVNQDPGACPLQQPTFPSAMTTNNAGFAEATFTTDKLAGAENFWISAVGGGQVLRSLAVHE